jgi:acyl carrier protein
MDKEIFYIRLAEILEKKVEEINDKLELKDVNWDSLSALAIIAAIDEIYDVVIPTKKLLTCESVSDIVNIIKNKILEKVKE